MTRDENNSTQTAASKKGSSPNWLWHAGVLVTLFVVNLVLYGRTVSVGFVSPEDASTVQNNRFVDTFRSENVRQVFARSYEGNYEPATILSYSADVTMAQGKSAGVFRVSNLLWHSFVVGAVYLLAFVIRGEIITAAAAALLFLFHPVHVEVVTWISNRRELVGGGFALLSMAGYLLWRRQRHHHGGWYIGSLFCFLVAATANSSVIVLPALMVMWDVVVEKRARWAVLFEKLPFAGVVFLVYSMTVRLQSAQHIWTASTVAATELSNLLRLAGVDFTTYNAAADGNELSLPIAFSCLVFTGAAWIIPLFAFGRKQPARLALSWWVLVAVVAPMVLAATASGPTLNHQLFLASAVACILLADLLAALATSFRFLWILALASLITLTSFWALQTSERINEWLHSARDAAAVLDPPRP